MALFKCIKAHTEADVVQREQRRGAGDKVVVIEVERTIAISPGAYGHENIKVDGVYEINGRLAEKARLNTEYFEEVKDIQESVESVEPEKKPRGRPPKTPVEAENVSNEGGNTRQSA